jgi:hypothetical protein
MWRDNPSAPYIRPRSQFERWSGYFQAWLRLKGWGWGPVPYCSSHMRLPVGNHGWERID